MEKGIIIFSHTNADGMREYFTETFKMAVEKVCAQLGIDILQWQVEEPLAVPSSSDQPPLVPLISALCGCAFPYLHQIMGGVAAYFQQTVQYCVCTYKKLS